MPFILSHNDVFWGYAAQLLKVGLGLLMLPLILHYLSAVEVGLYFVFITMASLSQLLESGIQPTLARNIAYIYAGAQRISAVGLENNGTGPLNTALLANCLGASRWLYRRIALLAALLLLIGGSIYLSSVLPKNQDLPNVYVSWFTFVVGTVVNFYYGYLNAFLQGRGDVTVANKVIIVSQSVQVLVGAILVASGLGLLGLGLASLLSTVVSRLMARQYVFSPKRPEMMHLTGAEDASGEVVKIIWHNASRLGIVSIGAFLVLRANILVASSYLGLIDAASFGLTIYVFSLLITLAIVPFNLSMPKLNSLQAQGNQEQIYRAFSSLLVMSLLVYLVAALVMALCGNAFLGLLGSATRLPNGILLSAMAVIYLLELNHGICANFIMTGNHIPFFKSAIIIGVGIVLLSILLAPVFGIAGLVLSQGLLQLLYNNWKWPMVVSEIFKTSYVKIIADGFSLFGRRLIRGN